MSGEFKDLTGEVENCPVCTEQSDTLLVYSNGDKICGSCGHIKSSGAKEQSVLENRGSMLSAGQYTNLTKRKIAQATCKAFKYSIIQMQEGFGQAAMYHENKNMYERKQHIRLKNKQFLWQGVTSPDEDLALFGQHLWSSEHQKEIVITLGELDAMSVAQACGMKTAAVSVSGGGGQGAIENIQRNYQFLLGFKKIILWFDSDELGKTTASEISKLFEPGVISIVKVPEGAEHKDANAVLIKFGPSVVRDFIKLAVKHRPDGIISGDELSVEFLLKQNYAEKFTTGYRKLDGMLKGLRKRELTMLTAGTGIGKSTMVKEIGFHLHQHHGLRVGHIALEESVQKTSLSYIGIGMNLPLEKLLLEPETVDVEAFTEAKNRIVNKNFFTYDHFGSLDSNDLLAKLRYMAVGLEVDFIVLDHISIMVSGSDSSKEGERKDIDKLMTALRSLVESTGVGILAVTHLKQPEGTPHEEGGRVTLSQLRGSASIKQLSDNIIGIERNQQGVGEDDENNTTPIIRLLKNRLIGITGVADRIEYDVDTGRLRSYESLFVENMNNNKTKEREDEERRKRNEGATIDISDDEFPPGFGNREGQGELF